MATIIVQEPKYNQVPVGSDIIFTVSNNTIVALEKKVKFIAEVHISSINPINTAVNTDVIGVFKTTPNNAGVGIFDLSAVLESYVKADNVAWFGSSYKLAPPFPIPLPIHLIDKFSINLNALKYLTIRFKIEYLGATDSSGQQDDDTVRIAAGESINSSNYSIFNGYLKRSDILRVDITGFGYNLSEFNPDAITDKFLTNAPTTQYAGLNDYGTFAMFQQTDTISYITVKYYDDAGIILQQEDIYKTWNNGAYNAFTTDIRTHLLYLGIFPANLQNWSTTFNTLVSLGTIQGGHYTVQAFGAAWSTQLYTININCPDLKGYEPIRLAWLNQWGVWDYYTFNKKSTKSISTSGSTYTQQSGTWNKATFNLSGYKGGKKSFRVNATEKIKMNTDFVSEAEGEWFEELINSPEIYILEGFQTDLSGSYLNNYVTPVRLTTSSYTKKTVANDKLMQYTFEVEKANTLRTQSI